MPELTKEQQRTLDAYRFAFQLQKKAGLIRDFEYKGISRYSDLRTEEEKEQGKEPYYQAWAEFMISLKRHSEYIKCEMVLTKDIEPCTVYAPYCPITKRIIED